MASAGRGWGHVSTRVVGGSPAGLGDSVVGFSVLVVCWWMAMEDARWMRPLFLHFDCSGVSGGGVRPTLALAVAGYRQGPFGPASPCPLRGLAVLREGSGEAPSPAWGPRQAYKMSKFAGATWSRDHRPPAELGGREPR